jgi:Tfp pilus assembly protein PilF
MIVFAVLVILACLFSPQPAVANERSQMLWSRGLIELQAGRYPAALELFQEAVDADPDDGRAHYYRAVARARLGDRDGAISDLRAVLAAEPDFDEAALDLGVTLIEEGRYAEALPWLEQARRSPPLATRASLFIGIAQLRDNQLLAAKESFARVLNDPEHGVTARYYAGVVDYQLGNASEAKQAFTAVVQAQPDSAVGREAQRFLELMQSPSGRWYSLSAGVGLNYDSNVILAPAVGGGDAQAILGVSQKADGEGTIRAGALVIPWQEAVTVSLAYDFFQSYHFELVEFDLQAHTVTAQVSSEAGLFRFGLLGRYDYNLLDTQSFLQATTASPWTTIRTGDIGRLALFYRMLWSDYKDRDFNVRNSFNHALGATQFFTLGTRDRMLSVGYQFDVEEPDIDQARVDAGDFSVAEAESYAYIGNELNLGAFWMFPLAIRAETHFAYRYEYYAAESDDFNESGGRRRDHDFLFSLSLRRRIWAGIDGVVAYFGDFNDSNNEDFNYDRSVVSLGVEARY